MLYTNNRLIKLEQKVDRIETRVDRQPTQRDAVEEVQSRFENYENNIGVKNGKITLRSNLIMRNRKAKLGGKRILDNSLDNVYSVSFNNASDSRLNHIFLGTDSREGNTNCTVFQAMARKKYDVEPSLNNGTIQLVLAKDKDIKDGVHTPVWEQPQLAITTKDLLPSEPGGRDDDYMQLWCNGDDGMISLAVNPSATEPAKGIQIDKNKAYPAQNFDSEGNKLPNSGYDLGEATNKFDTIHAVNTNFGDVTFQNNWKITEAWKVGIEEDGLAVLNDKDELIIFIGENGISQDVEYTKTTAGQRDMLSDEGFKSTHKEKIKRKQMINMNIN